MELKSVQYCEKINQVWVHKVVSNIDSLVKKTWEKETCAQNKIHNNVILVRSDKTLKGAGCSSKINKRVLLQLINEKVHL